MEEELNIAAILKDKPVDTKLHDISRNVTLLFKEIDWYGNIECSLIDGWILQYTNEGRMYQYPAGMEVLKPSAEMRDWSKFAWKKGDVLVYTDGERDYYVIFESFQNDEYTVFKSRYNYCGGNHWLQFNSQSCTNNFAKASDEEAKEFIKKVEEHYEGKLNLETLDIEKPKSEFKDGDIVRVDDEILIILKRDEFFDTYYHFFFRSNGTTAFDGSFGKCTKKYRLATDSEKQQLFDALAKEGKRWDEDKKMLVDLPKKGKFKPFDKILFKNWVTIEWMLGLYSHTRGNKIILVGGAVIDCSPMGNLIKVLPYNDQTKHLLGTTDEWEGGSDV